MELILTREKKGKFNVAGHNGGGVKAKERIGQSSNSLNSEYRINLPDKINAAWYIQLTDKVKGLRLVNFKDVVKVVDNSPDLVLAYHDLRKNFGVDYTTLKINMASPKVVNNIGRAILLLKKVAKNAHKY